MKGEQQMPDEKQVRINELARELEIKASKVTDYLPQIGVTEKKTHSGLIDSEQAELVRKHFRELAAQEKNEADAVLAAVNIQRVLISFDRKFRVLGEEMVRHHRAQSMSEYIRGLIVLDALVSRGEVKVMDERDIPSWLLSEFPLPVIRKFREEYVAHKAAKKPGISL
jgi:hypothetical protein